MEQPFLTRNMKITLVILVLIGALLYILSDVLTPIALALLLAYFFDPVVTRLESKGLSRTFSILVLMGAIILVLVGALFLFVPMLQTEIQRFSARLPGLLNAAAGKLQEYLMEMSGDETVVITERINDSLRAWVVSLGSNDLAPLTNVIGKTFSGTLSALTILIYIILVPIFSFYFLSSFDRIRRYPLELVPPRHREAVLSVTRDIDAMLSNFIRGQGTVCLILAVMYGAGYQLSGVPLGLMIGFIAGSLAFIPYVGAGTGLTLSLLMILLDWQGMGTLIGLLVTFGVTATLESYLITPKIVGDRVGLTPVMVIISLLTGATLFGFVGVLVAVPTAATLKILWGRARASYQRSAFFNDEEV